MNKLSCIFLLLTVFFQTAAAQDRLGLSTGNYAGLNGVFLNPSSISNSKKYLDINLASGGIFFANNFIYVSKEDNFLERKMNFAQRALKLEFPGFYDDDYIFSDRYDVEPKMGYTDLRLTGPSAMYSFNDHAFAIHFLNRFVVSGQNIPYDVAKFAYERRHYPQLHNTRFSHDNTFNIGSASWAELGLTFAKSFDYNQDLKITAGISIKRLWAYHGVYMRSDQLDYSFRNSDTLDIYNFSGQMAFALPVNFETREFMGVKQLVQGRGFGFDAGITIVKKHQNGRKNHGTVRHVYDPYQFRFGISLLDIGSLHYGHNAKSLFFDEASGRWPGLDSLNLGSINNLVEEMSSVIGNGSGQMNEEGSFNLWLPSAMSMQFDYSLGSDFYIQALWMQSLRFSKNQLVRPSQLSLVPRFEKHFCEVAVPLTLFRYQDPGIGFSVKLGYVTIGTEKLGAFFGLNDLEGVDFYFSLSAGLCKSNYQKTFDKYEKCHTFF
ncbi:MAG: hypothetical protein IH597_06225 [Bacteroidales bacterium]|nr:hypothetical protein [Bacteroidales bacterium]